MANEGTSVAFARDDVAAGVPETKKRKQPRARFILTTRAELLACCDVGKMCRPEGQWIRALLSIGPALFQLRQERALASAPSRYSLQFRPFRFSSYDRPHPGLPDSASLPRPKPGT